MRFDSRSTQNRPTRWLRLAAAIAFCLAFARGVRAQTAPVVVKAHLILSTDAAHPGEAARAAVMADITRGYHINDHHPSLDYLIPTELKLDPTKPFAVGNITYPKGKAQKFVFSDTPLSVYEGRIEIGVVINVGRGAAPGNYLLRGKLQYQACNDHACLPPASAPLALTVTVEGRETPLHRINSDVFRKIEPE